MTVEKQNICEYIKGITIVIPVYNSESTLESLHDRLCIIAEKLKVEYEIIFIDDGSKDNSWKKLCYLLKKDQHVKIIQLMRNFGQHNALLAGIRAADHDVIITMDDDLQNPPEEIPKLLNKLIEGYDVVYGKPEEKQHGLWRNLGSFITQLALQSAMGAETATKVSPFRALRTQVRDAFADCRGPFVSIDVLLTWGTDRFAAIKVRHDPRLMGTSNYTLGKLVTLAIDMMTGFSMAPLKLASLVGFAFTALGLLIFLYVIIRYFIAGSTVPGFPFLASLIAIFSGSQLLALGIMGEYMARMHFRTMNKPSYVVRLPNDKSIPLDKPEE
jgi:glycosyltransferase involved in cell wall biosynthesis